MLKPMLEKKFLEQNNLISRLTKAVFDPDFTRALKEVPWREWLSQSPPFDCRLEYLERIDRWIHSSRRNQVGGLGRFPERDLTIGTTQSFDEFYFRHRDRRIRFFRGEYAYHRRILPNFAFLEDEDLTAKDAVIVSWPFCSTGDRPQNLTEMLDTALALGVPVLVDAAYFGTCDGLTLDFSHPAIECVCFSLSKGVGLGDIRSGIRYSFYEDDLPIRQQNRFNHSVLADAKIGIHMMNLFSPDHIPEKYAAFQRAVCAEAGLQATPCMHLALASGPEWDDYKIDERYRRVGIRELVKARSKGLV